MKCIVFRNLPYPYYKLIRNFLLRKHQIVQDSCYLSTASSACSSTYNKDNNGDAVVVCGSPGEVANDPLAQGVFAPLGEFL